MPDTPKPPAVAEELNPEQLQNDLDYMSDIQNLDLLPGEPPEEEKGEEPSTSPESAPDPREVDEKRYQYWQSKHDKVRRQLDEIQAFMPYVQVLQSRPDILTQLSRGPSLPDMQGPPTAPAPGAELTQPTPPKRPRHYDPTDTDPESESAKYRAAKEDYNDQLIEYLQKRDELRQRSMEMALQAAAGERQREQFLSETRRGLAARGITGQAADEFLAWSTNPEVTLDDLVGLFRVRSGQPLNHQQAMNPAEAKQKAAEALEQRKRQVAPPSLASAGGQGELPSNLTDDQKVTQSFLRAAKQFM